MQAFTKVIVLIAFISFLPVIAIAAGFLTIKNRLQEALTTPATMICPAGLGMPYTLQSLLGRDTGCGFIPMSLGERLTADVKQYEDVSHRVALKKAEAAVKEILKETIPGIKIWMTGSVPAEVDFFGSDLDMTIKVEGLEGTEKKKLEQCMMMLLNTSGGDKCLQPKFQRANVSVLQLFHEATQTEIDVTIDNDAAKRNTQLLVWYGQIDARFQVLCRAVKDWAKSVGVQGAKDGRLNSFSLCLMVTHYLQVCGILPNLQELFPELNGDFEVENDDYQKRNLKKELEQRGYRFGDNESSVGVLFAGFLKYYAEFNFDKNWISVRHGQVMEKTRNEEGEPLDGMPKLSDRIVVADPFIVPAWNCAGSVWSSEILSRLQLEFKLSLARLIERRRLFGNRLKSVTRRKIEAAGKERDSQIQFWLKQIEDEKRAKTKETAKTISNDDWATPPETWATVWEEEPYQGYKDPKHFWDIKEKEAVVPPWPNPIRCSGY